MARSQEERKARRLYDYLQKTLTGGGLKANVTIEGSGLHWHCDAEWKTSSCRIHCFTGLRGFGEEYLIYLKLDDKQIATGRTPNYIEAGRATLEWLLRADISKMYDRFSFIDQGKRQLEEICAKAVANHPELATQANPEIVQEYSEFYQLLFSLKDRSCRISVYGKNEFPDCYFNWDDTQLFKIQTGDIEMLSLAVKRWLCDHGMPSALEEELPWIKTGKLAHFFEEGRYVEGEFIVSWDEIEEFYKSHFFHSQHTLSFIAQLRQLGFDKTLRAGQSMTTLIVSRSRRHGLRLEQPSISFGIHKDLMVVDIKLSSMRKEVRYPSTELNTEIIGFLKKLENENVD